MLRKPPPKKKKMIRSLIKIDRLWLTQCIGGKYEKKYLQDFLRFLQGSDPPEHRQHEHGDRGEEAGEYEAGQDDDLSHGGLSETFLQQVDQAVTGSAVEQHQD